MRAELIAAVCVVLLITPAGGKDAADRAPLLRPAGSLGVTPPEVDFGSQAVGTSSQPRNLTLTNTTNTNVTVGDITTSGIDFTQTNTCQQQLAAGANCTVAVTFTPAVTGLRLGTLIVSDSAASPHFVVLTGTGE